MVLYHSRDKYLDLGIQNLRKADLGLSFNILLNWAYVIVQTMVLLTHAPNTDVWFNFLATIPSTATKTKNEKKIED